MSLGHAFFRRMGKLNAAHYLSMPQHFLIQELRRRLLLRNHVWFQQDGAPAHTAVSYTHLDVYKRQGEGTGGGSGGRGGKMVVKNNYFFVLCS